MDDSELQLLYSWIDEIPLSRPKRNITRDFSDGMMIAEVRRRTHQTSCGNIYGRGNTTRFTPCAVMHHSSPLFSITTAASCLQ